MRKTSLLTGVAALLFMAAPAFAQDAAAPQAPPAAAEAATAPAAPQTLTLQPGANVKGSDGTVVGQLEGARNTAAGQELTVRGGDGQLRGVPVSGGVRQDGADIAVGWTSAQFQSAPVIAADAATPAPAEPVADPAAAADPMEPVTEPTPAPLTEAGQSPAPGEAEQVPPPVDTDETPTAAAGA